MPQGSLQTSNVFVRSEEAPQSSKSVKYVNQTSSMNALNSGQPGTVNRAMNEAKSRGNKSLRTGRANKLISSRGKLAKVKGKRIKRMQSPWSKVKKSVGFSSLISLHNNSCYEESENPFFTE